MESGVVPAGIGLKKMRLLRRKNSVEVLLQAELWRSLLLQVKWFYLLKGKWIYLIARAMLLELCSHIDFAASR